MENKKSIFKRIHTDKFKWYDEIVIVLVLTILLLILGSILGQFIGVLPFINLIKNDETGFWNIFSMYFSNVGLWAVILLFCGIIKRYRPILKAVWTLPKGNRITYLIIGLFIGFVMNMTCAVGAMLNKDIAVYFDSFQFLKLLLLFIAVFVQSSAEELLCRGFLYQIIRRGYRHPAVAIVGNAALFAILHIFNPGISAIPVINIFLIGIFFSLLVYYMDSIWCAMAVHAAWNFTQNIILGLPNSGIVTPYSLFKLDAAAAENSFAYSVDFGIEGTILATIVEIVACVLIIAIYHKKNVKPYDPWQ